LQAGGHRFDPGWLHLKNAEQRRPIAKGLRQSRSSPESPECLLAWQAVSRGRRTMIACPA
jgi:hypothetical protein